MAAELWKLEQATELTEFYNRQVQKLPFGDPAEPAEFLSGMLWSQAPQLIDHDGEQLVVYSGGRDVLAFAHIGACRPRGSEEEIGLVRFLAYEPGQVQAARAVLELMEETLAAGGHRRVVAFPIEHGYRHYHLGRGFLVDGWTHVLGLLRTGGYAYDEGQLLLQLDPVGAEEPEMPDEVTGSRLVVTPISSDYAGLPFQDEGLRIRLVRADTELARCTSRPVSHHHSGPRGREAFIVEGLHVVEELRGLGWGRYLLLRMHDEMRQRGYRTATIGVLRDNDTALFLYGNAGYRVVCSEWTFTKEL